MSLDRKPEVTDDKARRTMVAVVRAWLRGDLDTPAFIARYWNIRRELLTTNGSAFVGPFGQIMSAMDTAADRHSEDPDPAFSEIDEAQLRTEASSVIDRLRAIDMLRPGDVG